MGLDKVGWVNGLG